MSMRVYHLHSA